MKSIMIELNTSPDWLSTTVSATVMAAVGVTAA